MKPRLCIQVCVFLITASVVCLAIWIVATLELFHEADASPVGEPARADVIVVLSGEPDRAAYAAFLARQGAAARVVSTLLDPRCLEVDRPHRPVAQEFVIPLTKRISCDACCFDNAHRTSSSSPPGTMRPERRRSLPLCSPAAAFGGVS